MADVNGSKFHLLLTRQDWFGDGRAPVRADWTTATGLGLQSLLTSSASKIEERLSLTDRRGSARDRYGTWWTIDDAESAIIGSRSGRSTRVWPAPVLSEPDSLFHPLDDATADITLRGLAVTESNLLVVGVVGQGLLVFDLGSQRSPQFVAWTAGPAARFRPFDMAAQPDGGLLLLEFDGSEASKLWSLDVALQPMDAGSAEVTVGVFRECARPALSTGDGSIASTPLRQLPAVAVESLDDGRYLLLDNTNNQVLLCEDDATLGTLDLTTALVDVVASPDDESVLVRGHDIAVLNHDGDATLYVSERGGDRVFAFDIVGATFVARSDTYWLRRHHGRALVAAGDAVWFDSPGGWHALSQRGRPRFATEAEITTEVLDGDQLGCVWHRVLLDGCVPVGTRVVVESRAHDDADAVASAPWRTEPELYLRRSGTEQPYDVDVVPADRGRVGTWETLVQASVGRWCQFRITLLSDGSASPRIHALRLVFPRFSYLHEYLPEIYAQRDAGDNFLDRFLANFEGLFTDIEMRIINAQLLFDQDTAPEEYLQWLASWFGHVFDEELDAHRRRLFLTHAMTMFRERGTIAGLIRSIRLLIDDEPERAFESETDAVFGVRIVESFEARQLGLPIPDGPGEIGQTAQVDPAARWNPTLGAGELHARFRNFLFVRHGVIAGLASDHWLVQRDQPLSSVQVSPMAPAPEDARADWQDFLGLQLGVRQPTVSTGDTAIYRRFLLQRYGSFRRYREIHNEVRPMSGLGFDDVALPAKLPTAGPELQDWFDLVTLVLPIHRAAHHFSVLLPTQPETDEDEQLRQLDRARRVVEVERPAHTTFDVRHYWAAFQLGDALLGEDTLVSTPPPSKPFVLGRERLARAALSAGAGSISCLPLNASETE